MGKLENTNENKVLGGGSGGQAATIYDVAKRAGVSISTVSRVLNTPDKVNPETRSTVLAAMDALQYTPSAESRARAQSKTGRIGVVTPFFTAPSFVQRLRGAATALTPTGYELVVYTVDTQARLESYMNTIPISRNLDGLIVMSLRIEAEAVKRLVERELPTVLIEYPHAALNTIEIDDFAGGQLAAEHLLGRGHRRMAFLGDTNLPEYTVHPITQRLAGFRQALEKAGSALPPEHVHLMPYDLETTRQLTRQMLAAGSPPSAIFAATDLQALGVVKAARDLGLRVPQDLAVLGFDDLDIAGYTGLSTISQHLDESGRVAVELLLNQIASPGRLRQHIHLPLSLIERETT